MTTQRYFDPKQNARITVTAVQKKKKKKMQKQYARNKIQELMMMQMQMMLKMSQTQQTASRNYLTTPIDKWTKIDRAKNELVAMGKGYEDTYKGITALKKDIERIETGLTDKMSNWNDFMQNVTPIVRDAMTIPTQTEVVDVGLDPIMEDQTGTFVVGLERQNLDAVKSGKLRVLFNELYGDTAQQEFSELFTPFGSIKKSVRKGLKVNNMEELLFYFENVLDEVRIERGELDRPYSDFRPSSPYPYGSMMGLVTQATIEGMSGIGRFTQEPIE